MWRKRASVRVSPGLFRAIVAIQFLLAVLGVLGSGSIEAQSAVGLRRARLMPIQCLVAAITGRREMCHPPLRRGVLYSGIPAAPPLPTQNSTGSGLRSAPRAQRLVHLRPQFLAWRGFPRHERGRLRVTRSCARDDPALPIPLDDLSPWLRATRAVREREGGELKL